MVPRYLMQQEVKKKLEGEDGPNSESKLGPLACVWPSRLHRRRHALSRCTYHAATRSLILIMDLYVTAARHCDGCICTTDTRKAIRVGLALEVCMRERGVAAVREL